MSDQIIATVENFEETSVVVQELGLASISSELYNPATVPRLADVGDVDSTVLTNGSVLVYRTNTSRWTSTTTLDAQNMEGGEF